MAVSDADKIAARARAVRRCAFLSALDTLLLDDIVDDAACLMQPEAWGKKLVPGLSMLICHYGYRYTQLSGGAAAAGPIASRSIGKLSTSYGSASMSQADSEMASTVWGQGYLTMRATIIIAPLTGRVC